MRKKQHPWPHPVPMPGPASGAADAVEVALANAITAAVADGKFDVVSQLCREIEARRLARAGNVVAINGKWFSRS